MSLPIIAYVGCYSHLAPITAGLVKMKRLSTPMKILLSLIIIFFILTVVELVVAIYRRNNLEIENFGQIVETVGICFIFLVAIKVKKFRVMTSILLSTYVLLLLVTIPFFHIPNQIDILAAILGKITLIIAGIIYLFYDLIYETKLITQDPVFWVAVGNLIFTAGTIVIYAVPNHKIAMGSELGHAIWFVAHILVIVTNGFYMKGFFCNAS
jgi:hypothetical protein